MASLSFEGLTRASTRRPWATIGAWVALIALAIFLNVTLLADALTTEFGFSNNPESIQANDLLEERLRGPKKASEVVVIQSDKLTVDDPEFEALVGRVFEEITGLGPEKVESGVNYYMTRIESFVSADRKTTIMPIVMTGTLNDATTNVEEVLEIVRSENGKDGFKVATIGEASIAAESNELAEADISKGESIGVPVALLIMLVLFGAVVAALIPIGLAIVAIVVALGATSLLGQVFELIFFITLMITMIGLAVGIDYSLIVVSRFREELSRGRDKIDAIALTGATAGRTVFFSGVTVVLAMSGMLIIPVTVFQALGAGAILVVIAAVLAALTLLPAVLVLLGPKVNALTLPIVGRRAKRPAGEESEGFWSGVVRFVMGRPVISLVVVAGLMLGAAYSALDLDSGFNGVDAFPDSAQAKEAFFILDKEFSFGVAVPTEIVIDGNTATEQVQEAIDKLLAVMAADPDFVGVPTPQVNPAGDLTLLSTAVAGEAASDEAVDAVRRLRDKYIPDAFQGVPATVVVTGVTAFNIDFFDITGQFTPIVFAIVLALSFVLLTVIFRSVVIPVQAIVMNLLSVGTAYGLMVLVFQKGVGIDLLGFDKTGRIDAWIPLFLFSVLFGLSMDYHVFLLSRIRERYDQTKDSAESIAYGLRATAGLITGAALIMVAVFGGFAAGDLVSNQQVGFGLAVAVFLDATLVRIVLVPATMRLLGDFNWYLPSMLKYSSAAANAMN